MSDQILSRESIARDADAAAARAVQFGVEQPNPHDAGTAAHAAWRAAYLRFLLLHSAPDAEGSA